MQNTIISRIKFILGNSGTKLFQAVVKILYNKNKCDATCQNLALSLKLLHYQHKFKLSFYMIYHLCLYAIPNKTQVLPDPYLLQYVNHDERVWRGGGGSRKLANDLF